MHAYENSFTFSFHVQNLSVFFFEKNKNKIKCLTLLSRNKTNLNKIKKKMLKHFFLSNKCKSDLKRDLLFKKFKSLCKVKIKT